MNRGFDTTDNCGPHAFSIKQAGYTFVCRYYSHSAWKSITPEEAKALSQHGIYIVAVWETAGDHAGFFTYHQGLRDGANADAFGVRIGQPFGTPIYFAVDADLPCHPDDNALTGVWAYFRGVRAALRNHPMGHQYSAGVYGSGLVCRVLHEAGMVTHTWLAQSTGWSDSQHYADWNLLQGASSSVFGLSIDHDAAAAKGGGGFLVK